MKDRTEKLKLFIALGEMYGVSFSEITLRIYLDAFEGVPIEKLTAVVSLGLRKNMWKFMPRPGEILALGVRQEPEKRIAAEESFHKILHAAQRGKVPELNDHEQNVLRLVGGFNRFRMCEDHEIHWVKKSFLDLFLVAEQANDNLQLTGEIKKLTESINIKTLGKPER